MLPPPPDLGRPRGAPRLPFLDFCHQPTSQSIGTYLQRCHDMAAGHAPLLDSESGLSGGQETGDDGVGVLGRGAEDLAADVGGDATF